MTEGISELPKGLEVKPQKPGILADIFRREVVSKSMIDDLIVFGQGPVMDMKTFSKPKKGETGVVEGINSWAKALARAAGELYKAGACKRIILSGGPSGGEGHKSEAQLMKQVLLEEYNIPESDLVEENEALKTPANLVHAINWIDNDKKTNFNDHKTVGLLASDFQLTRVKALAKLFGVEYKNAFSAEAILRLIAHETDDRELHALLDRRLNPNDDLSHPNTRMPMRSEDFRKLSWAEKAKIKNRSFVIKPTYFEGFQGEEAMGITKRLISQQIWQMGDEDMQDPRSWIGFVGLINDESRLQEVLTKVPREILQKLEIPIDGSISEIKEALEQYRGKKRVLPKQWGEYDEAKDPDYFNKTVS